MIATFILFDFVVNNPNHSETKRNIVYLDIAAGYFQRLDLAVPGSPVGYLIAEFSTIAKEYIKQQKNSPQLQQTNRHEPQAHLASLASTAQGVTEELIGDFSNPALSLQDPEDFDDTVIDGV